MPHTTSYFKKESSLKGINHDGEFNARRDLRNLHFFVQVIGAASAGLCGLRARPCPNSLGSSTVPRTVRWPPVYRPGRARLTPHKMGPAPNVWLPGLFRARYKLENKGTVGKKREQGLTNLWVRDNTGRGDGKGKGARVMVLGRKQPDVRIITQTTASNPSQLLLTQ